MYSRETFIGVYRDFLTPKPPRPPLIALYGPDIVTDRDILKRPLCLGGATAVSGQPNIDNIESKNNNASSNSHSPSNSTLVPITTLNDIVWYYCPTELESIGPVSLEDLKGYVEMGILPLSVTIHLSEGGQKWKLQRILEAQEGNDMKVSAARKASLKDSKIRSETERELLVSERCVSQCEISMEQRCEQGHGPEHEVACHQKTDSTKKESLRSSPLEVEKIGRTNRRARQAKNKAVQAKTEPTNMVSISSSNEKMRFAPKPNVWKNTLTMIAGVLTEAAEKSAKDCEPKDAPTDPQTPTQGTKVNVIESGNSLPRGNAWATPLLMKNFRIQAQDTYPEMRCSVNQEQTEKDDVHKKSDNRRQKDRVRKQRQPKLADGSTPNSLHPEETSSESRAKISSLNDFDKSSDGRVKLFRDGDFSQKRDGRRRRRRGLGNKTSESDQMSEKGLYK